MESNCKIESIVIPTLMFIAIAIFIYGYYKKRGRDN